LINSVNKVPWLGDIPVLGAFFRSTSINRQDKELIMIVTPHLVRPLSRETQLPPLPGAKYDSYNPSFTNTMFMERGDFDTGFSK
jgi:pilus assembly protein CpaC